MGWGLRLWRGCRGAYEPAQRLQANKITVEVFDDALSA